MKTRQRMVLLGAAVVLVASACSSANVAATVNGSEITEDFVLSLRNTYANRTSVSGETFRNDLSRLIFTEAMLTAAETDFGLTGLGTASARDAYVREISPAEETYLAGVAEDADFTAALVDVAVNQLIVRAAVREALALDPENIQWTWENEQANLEQVCVRHVLTETEAEAVVVRGRLDAGEDFAVVADDVSIDGGSPGGQLPCPLPLTSYVGPFGFAIIDATVGESYGPFQTQFGWHVIIVDSLASPATLDELAADPLRWMTPAIIDVFWAPWLNDVVERSDIKVRSDIGMWYPPVDGILPPRSSP